MRPLCLLFAAITLSTAGTARAERVDALQPAVVFTVKFGGPRVAFTAPKLAAELQYAGEAAPDRRPAALRWEVDGRGHALALSGVPVYAQDWNPDPAEGNRLDLSDRGARAVTTSVSWTLVGGGALLIGINAFMKSFGDGVGQGVVDATSPAPSEDSGGNDNGGSICVGEVCPVDGGG